MFKLDNNVMSRLCSINEFRLPEDGLLVFGLRGCLPTAVSDYGFRADHDVRTADVNYRNLRCTIGLWDRGSRELALFAASTVPYITYVKESSEIGGQNTNQLMESFVSYTKGWHYAYQALRQNSVFAVQRVVDDVQYDYDDDDIVEVGTQGDNIHASRCDSLTHAFYSSRGCQVIVGHPEPNNGGIGGTGGWRRFQQYLYDRDQADYQYVLLKGTDALEAATSPADSVAARVRFGSSGTNTEAVQQALHDQGYGGLVGAVDGSFGRKTLKAIRALQGANKITTDGVVGPSTADALGLANWPRF